jgi:aryl-alcohol dehydrogenase-like predicted oxidoreductase
LKKICLGSAMWGWSVSKTEAFKILDLFYLAGGRYIDTAFNYPINNRAQDLSLAGGFLQEWTELNGVSDLSIIYKAGSLFNDGSNQYDLSANRLLQDFEERRIRFGTNLACFMVHWDDRSEASQIEKTCDALRDIGLKGVALGLSGIKSPDCYYSPLSRLAADIYIEAKFSFLENSFDSYRNFLRDGAKSFAYGISGSGLKLDRSNYRKNSYVSLVRDSNYHDSKLTPEVRRRIEKVLDCNPKLKTLYHLGMAFAEVSDFLYGYIVAPSSVDQMKDILEFRDTFSSVNFERDGLNLSGL